MRRWLSLGTGVGLVVVLSGSLTAQGRRAAGAIAPAQASAPAAAQAAAATSSQTTQWVGANSGAIPAGAIAYGRDASGNQEYACRAAIAGGTHIGRIASGMTGCGIAIGGREVVIAAYEVLASPSSGPARGRAAAAAAYAGAAGQAAGAQVIGVISPPQGQRRPPDAPAQPESIRRGFDEDGNPYYEVTMPDGSIRRTLQNGNVVIIKQDGTQQTYPPQYAMHHAPTPDPPQLPADPARGRAWMERHNRDLLEVISTLVKGNEAEMKKFSTAEAQSAGTDLFKQILYRTSVAGFLVSAR